MAKFSFNAIPSQTLAVAASIESGVMDLRLCRAFAVQMKAAASGSAAKLEYATSPDGTNFDSYDDNPDLIADNNTEFPNNTEGWNTKLLDNDFPNRYVKLKVTGLATNPANTVVAVNLMCKDLGDA